MVTEWLPGHIGYFANKIILSHELSANFIIYFYICIISVSFYTCAVRWI